MREALEPISFFLLTEIRASLSFSLLKKNGNPSLYHHRKPQGLYHHRKPQGVSHCHRPSQSVASLRLSVRRCSPKKNPCSFSQFHQLQMRCLCSTSIALPLFYQALQPSFVPVSSPMSSSSSSSFVLHLSLICV
ncbi:uncharacterized protein LOC107493763 [Arachis duranensis]|uniref:Uncharacterized protein LOC107493763 n=1 Tax=Arachis duranensis TaxID=130453 RepID=A0A6P4DLI3_ARADU|nr:uncharacterized protein LOC107493763 [Arachis duranensis]